MLLMHKNDIVARVQMYNRKPMGVEGVVNDNLMPMGLRGSLEKADCNISAWNAKRAIPRGRINSEELFKRFGDPDALSVKSYGLSLTDCYWLKDENSNLTWENVNLFSNSFTPDMLLFMNHMLNKQGISPDYTTDGMLEKFWTIINRKPCLVKSGEFPGVTKGSGILAVNEIATCRIAKLMEIPHAEYKATHVEGIPGLFCSSKCIIENDSTEFVPAFSIKEQFFSFSDSDSVIGKVFADMGLERELKQMLKFDFLIGNYDRHLSNLGIIQDSQTMDIVGFAPLFDSGSSLAWNGELAHNLRPFDKTRDECAKELVTEDFPEKETVLKIIQETYEENNVPEYCHENARKTIEVGYEMVAEKIKEQSVFFQ